MGELKIQIGDCIHYGVHGVCKVCGREEREASFNNVREYFLLQPVSDEKIQLYLPVDADPDKVKVRKLLSREEIVGLLGDMDSADATWINDSKARRENWNRIIREGNAQELLCMLRDLHLHQDALPEGKQLPLSDREMMRSAERLLYGEISFVMDIDEDQVSPFIQKEIARACPAKA